MHALKLFYQFPIDLQPCHCILSSVAFRDSTFSEVEAFGIYHMNLALGSTTLGLSPWANWKSNKSTIQSYPSVRSILSQKQLSLGNALFSTIYLTVCTLDGVLIISFL